MPTMGLLQCFSGGIFAEASNHLVGSAHSGKHHLVRGLSRACVSVLLAWLLALNGGCLVTSTTRMSQPAGIPGVAKAHMCTDELNRHFCLHCKLAAADLEVGALTPEAENLAFFSHGRAVATASAGSTKPEFLRIRLAINPKGSELTLDPSRFFYTGTNQVLLAPRLVEGRIRKRWSLEGQLICYGDPKPISVTKYSYFYLQYDAEADPDIRFMLCLKGLAKSGQPVPVPDIHFQPTDIRHIESIAPMVFAPR